MKIFFLITMFILGACFGSFLCCEARRLRLREKGTALKTPEKTPEKTSRTSKKDKPAKKKKISLPARSICLSCGYQLKWYDNIPIFSWLFLHGKCRKCKTKIGTLEIIAEIGTALAFLLLGFTAINNGLTLNSFLSETPLTYISYALWFFLVLALIFLAIYDGAYGELPTPFLTFSLICAILIIILKEWSFFSVTPFSFNLLFSHLLPILYSVLILGGLYLVLNLISKGKWVGDGDWLLGTIVGLMLGKPWLALLALFLSNFVASLIMLPSVKKSKNFRIFFGPFMIIAFILVIFFSSTELYDIINLW